MKNELRRNFLELSSEQIDSCADTVTLAAVDGAVAQEKFRKVFDIEIGADGLNSPKALYASMLFDPKPVPTLSQVLTSL